jgi:hypothetical protein
LARKVQLVTRQSSLVNSIFVRAALRRKGARGVSTENYQLRHSIEARGDIVLNLNIFSYLDNTTISLKVNDKEKLELEKLPSMEE